MNVNFFRYIFFFVCSHFFRLFERLMEYIDETSDVIWRWIHPIRAAAVASSISSLTVMVSACLIIYWLVLSLMFLFLFLSLYDGLSCLHFISLVKRYNMWMVKAVNQYHIIIAQIAYQTKGEYIAFLFFFSFFDSFDWKVSGCAFALPLNTFERACAPMHTRIASATRILTLKNCKLLLVTYLLHMLLFCEPAKETVKLKEDTHTLLLPSRKLTITKLQWIEPKAEKEEERVKTL